MRSTAAAAITFAALALPAVPAWAHHSFAAAYNEGTSIAIEGDVVNYDYRNPHTFITVNVTDAEGKTVLWTAEWRAPRMLDSMGVTKDTIHPGDHIQITGAPGREAEDHKIHLKSIKRPADGFQVQDRGRGFGGQNRFNR
jgi:hypothetical protein